MWEIPRYRVRAYIRSMRNARVRERERIDRRRIHFKRVKVELRIGDGFGAPMTVLPARAILNDLSRSSFKLFTAMELPIGAEVALTMDHPRYFFIRARVMFCNQLSYDSRILSQTPCQYRVGLKFIFSTVSEELAVEAYCKQLFEDYIYAPKIGTA